MGHSHSHSHGSGAGHGHGHHHDLRNESKKKMLMVLGLTSSYMLVEVIVGFMSHSLALLADAGHMLSDVGALLLSLLAVWFASKPATPGKTYGYYRSEILAGFFNALVLAMLSLFIIYESWRRLTSPPEVTGMPVLIVAIFGLIMNFVSLKLLSKSADASINAKAAYLEILGDLLATIGVIVSSIVILTTHWYAADPLISGIIGLAILPRTWMLIVDCINILMEGTPGHIDLSSLRNAMLDVEGVVDVHDMHVWTITSGLDAMSGHVKINDSVQSDTVLNTLTTILNEKFELRHTTIQIEQVACQSANETCQVEHSHADASAHK